MRRPGILLVVAALALGACQGADEPAAERPEDAEVSGSDAREETDPSGAEDSEGADDRLLADVAVSICQALEVYDPQSRFESYERQVAAQVRDGHEDRAVRDAVEHHCGELIATIEAPGSAAKPEPPPVGAEFVSGDEVDARFRDGIEDHLRDAAAFVDELTGYRTDDYTVFLFREPEPLVDARMQFFGSPEHQRADLLERWSAHSFRAEAGRGNIFMLSDRTRTGYQGMQSTITHEYVHVIQWERAPEGHVLDAEVGPLGPIWLAEGVAEYIAALHIDALGGTPIDEKMDSATFYVERDVDDVTLSQLESWQQVWEAGSTPAYAMGALAADWLADQHGVRSLLAYYEAVGDTGDWRVAFEQTFEQTLEEFYDEFAVYRAAGFVDG